jgi:hypothetical protein
MRNFLLFLIFLLTPAFFLAQDTLTVQTFTWDSETRSGDFTFPDQSEGPFEKVLMIYNMRCHDAQVGSGSVGCREWDYSCNTFVTIPEQTDSIIRFHPTHTVSDFEGTDLYEYSNSPVYTYYQYNQFETTYSNTLSENTAEVGLGEALTSLTYGNSVGKTHYLFTASELVAAGLSAGEITGLRFYFQNVEHPLNFLRIKFKATTKTDLSSASPDLDGFTEVYFKNTELNNDDWHQFNFYQPFEWDGTSNLMVEVSHFHSNDAGNITATATGTAHTSALSGHGPYYALEFNGAGNIPINTDAMSTIADEITVSLWVKGNAETMPRNSTIFEGTDADNQRQVNVHLPWNNGRVYWDCGNDGSGYDRIDQAANEIDYEGIWNHWAFTKNANTGEMKIYLNGALWHSGTGKTKPIDIQNFTLASSVNGSQRYYGQISEFRVFSKALDESTIAEWMHQPLSNTHPDFDQLISYFPLNEGSGPYIDNPFLPAIPAVISGTPGWREVRGKDAFKYFSEASIRPNTVFIQGEYEEAVETLTVLDSILNIQNEIIEYTVNAENQLIPVDTIYHWEGVVTIVYDEAGNLIDIVDVPVDGEIEIGTLEYFDKRESKLELLSLVTPYGNGLDLGQEGKTFIFDITDFSPILQGERFISVEMGGQWQEELDMKFLFIKGTPPRDVLGIQNIWAFERGWYQPIVDDTKFEPRTLHFDSQGLAYKIRSSITGHGQNGEFVPRDHYINLNGGSQEFVYEVWKECGYNPVYPQGGTWIFDRAGWCPGMATDVHEFEITDLVSPGGTAEIDYGVNGSVLGEANYLVSNQLVTYGAPNFETDAAIEAIMRPSQRVEFERLNPACNLPQIIIKNTGSATLTSLQIDYGVQGGMSDSYEWTGSLDFLETEIVTLPVDDVHFWNTDQSDSIFEVTVSSPNGGQDEYANNNYLTSAFAEATILDDPDLILQTRTNNRASENRYTIKDYAGNVVLQRNIMFNNSVYDDEISLPAGCYSLDFEDDGDDGLEFWYWAVIGQNVGNGQLAFKRVITPTASIPVKTFDPDFGGGLKFDFVIPQSEAADEIENPMRFSVFPNPAMDEITIELFGFPNQRLQVQLTDLTGKVLKSTTIDHDFNTQIHPFRLPEVAGGMYFLKITNGEQVRTREIVILD